jgi:hypothetical protein
MEFLQVARRSAGNLFALVYPRKFSRHLLASAAADVSASRSQERTKQADRSG